MVALEFRRHLAVRAHAEGAHAVVEGRRVEDRLYFVELVGDVLRPGGGDLHAHADVHRQRLYLQPERVDGALHPGRAFASGRQQHVVREYLFAAFERHARGGAVLLEQHTVDGRARHYVAVALHRFVHRAENVFRAVRPHMADHRGDYVKSGLQGARDHLLCQVAAWLEEGLARAVAQIYLVGLGDEGEQLFTAAVFLEVPAELRGERELSVAEGPGSSPAADDVAGAALHALGAAELHRAFPVFDRTPLLDDDDLFTFIRQLHRGKKACGAGAHYYRVVTFCHVKFLRKSRTFQILLDNFSIILETDRRGNE